MSDTLFACEGISQNYGSTRALKGVSFRVGRGEIVGLVGENGAGKSTLMKIMQGIEKPAAGQMYMRGEPYSPSDARASANMGVGMVFQEQSLLTNLSVAQNLFFGEEGQFCRLGLVDWRAMNSAAQQILDALGLKDIKAERKIADIQFSRRQMVEIAKVLHRAAQKDGGALVLLDEPTSVLSGEEIKILFDKMRLLKETGNGVVFISHRLNEILDICDKIVVFKDGECAGELSGPNVTEGDIFQMMIGKGSSSEFYRESKQRESCGDVLLEAEDLGLFGFFKGVNFTLRAGEVVSVYGVVGSGKEHLCRVLGGDETHSFGRLKLHGKPVVFHAPNVALRHGICCVPTERRIEGQIGMANIRENISYACMDKLGKFGFISGQKERALADRWIAELRIKCEGWSQPIENLSGGNAQKVVFARALSSEAMILILNHPTRGVDVGAKEEIYDIIRGATARGAGVILQGDTLDECIGLSNKILVMKDGLVTKTVDAPSAAKPAQIDVLRYMM